MLTAKDSRNITGTGLSPMFMLCHTAVTLGRAIHGLTPTPDGPTSAERRLRNELSSRPTPLPDNNIAVPPLTPISSS